MSIHGNIPKTDFNQTLKVKTKIFKTALMDDGMVPAKRENILNIHIEKGAYDNITFFFENITIMYGLQYNLLVRDG